MKSLNRCTVIGNIGKQPELRQVGGKDVLNLSVATNEEWVTKSGEKQEHTEWHRGSVWGNRAVALSRILNRGDRIYVEGPVRTRSWDDNGEKKYSSEIKINEVVLLGGGKAGGEKQPPANAGGYDAPTPNDDDIPF